jgi:RNA polymerase sigma-70 factor (ECF subfamily)
MSSKIERTQAVTYTPQSLPWKSAAAFETFYKEHFVKMIILCGKMVDDKDLSCQLVQEAFYRIWEKRDTLDHVKNPAGYLYRTVKYTALDYLRKIRRELSSLDIDPNTIADDNDYTDNDELLRIIRTASQELPGKCRTVFQMTHFQGFSINEIATYLDISPLTVKKQKSIAIQKLRAALLPLIKTFVLCVFVKTNIEVQKFFYN